MRNSRWLLIAMLCCVGTAEASWIREYDRGLQAVRQEDWAEAERRFAAALREDGTPQERRRFQGAIFRPYVPHYYAGLAAYRRGDCQTAMEYWSHAPTAAVLRQLQDEQAEFQRGVAACRTRLAQAAPTPAAPSSPTPSTPAASAPAPSASRAPATASATPERRAPEPATATPARSAPAPVASAPPPAPSRSAPAPAARSAPAALRSAVDAYLAGRYPELLRIDAASAGDGRDRAQLHLFRAAAAFVLAEQAGQAEGSALDNARREVRAARAAQSSLQPDEVMFSPRFRRFWQQTR